TPGRGAHLAVQQGLGLLPERRLGSRADHRAHPGLDRENVVNNMETDGMNWVSRNPTRQRLFSRFANWISNATGHPSAFLIWLAVGPWFHYSDSWQLVINTITTVVTFLMVFLIQNAQNRSACAIQIKLGEIIRALEGAHNALLDLEHLSDEELAQLGRQYAA